MKTQQIFKSKKHNIFAQEINNIALSSNDNKRMKSIDPTETHTYGTNQDLVREKEEIKCNNIMKQYNSG